MVAIVIRSLFHSYIDKPARSFRLQATHATNIISDFLSGCSTCVCVSGSVVSDSLQPHKL